jgi:hypothetical protein
MLTTRRRGTAATPACAPTPTWCTTPPPTCSCRGTTWRLRTRQTRCLTSFSLDFERQSANVTDGPDMQVQSVTVHGAPATFTFEQPTDPGDSNGQDDPDPLAHDASQHDPVGGPVRAPPSARPPSRTALSRSSTRTTRAEPASGSRPRPTRRRTRCSITAPRTRGRPPRTSRCGRSSAPIASRMCYSRSSGPTTVARSPKGSGRQPSSGACRTRAQRAGAGLLRHARGECKDV